MEGSGRERSREGEVRAESMTVADEGERKGGEESHGEEGCLWGKRMRERGRVREGKDISGVKG